jgi:hypothetical protein
MSETARRIVGYAREVCARSVSPRRWIVAASRAHNTIDIATVILRTAVICYVQESALGRACRLSLLVLMTWCGLCGVEAIVWELNVDDYDIGLDVGEELKSPSLTSGEAVRDMRERHW